MICCLKWEKIPCYKGLKTVYGEFNGTGIAFGGEYLYVDVGEKLTHT